jgi:hypothetical protein
LSRTGKLVEKIVLKIVKKDGEERGLLRASHFDCHAHHNMTLQCMRLTDHMTLYFNNISTAAVLLDIEKAFDPTWHSSLLYNLYILQTREV